MKFDTLHIQLSDNTTPEHAPRVETSHIALPPGGEAGIGLPQGTVSVSGEQAMLLITVVEEIPSNSSWSCG